MPGIIETEAMKAVMDWRFTEGEQWTIAIDGNKTTLMRVVDGDQVPVNIMKVVILDYAKRRGRAYYEGAYDPANESAPVSWSDDGLAPDETVPAEVKQAIAGFFAARAKPASAS